MVLNKLTSGIEDPKSGETGNEETRFLVKWTSGINDPRSEGGLVYCFGQ
jgi:hypothetical protein